LHAPSSTNIFLAAAAITAQQAFAGQCVPLAAPAHLLAALLDPQPNSEQLLSGSIISSVGTFKLVYEHFIRLTTAVWCMSMATK
jgi:hypothetical protein